MSWSRLRREASIMVPAAMGAAGMGVVSAVNPAAGVGVGSLTVFALLPWLGMFAAFDASALANRWGLDVAGVTIRAAQAVLIPFALRAFSLTGSAKRPRWYAPEWLMAGFIVLQFFTSYFNADLRRVSVENAGILALGAITYYGIYACVSDRRRLIAGTRLLLGLAAAGAAIGAVLLLAYFVTGWTVGIELRQIRVFGGAPPVRGLAYEHDLFGSTCAAAAIAFFSLLRAQSGVFGRRALQWGFWLSLVGTIISQARAAYVGLAVCLLLALLLQGPRSARPRGLPRTALVMVLVGASAAGVAWAANATADSGVSAGVNPIPVIGSSVTYQITQSLNLSSGTGGHRVAKYRQAFDELISSPMPEPLIGEGTNSWGQRHFHPGRRGQVTPAYLESLYVRALYDSGFLGFLLQVGFVLFLVWPIRAIRLAAGDVGAVARALTLAATLLAISYAATDSTLLIWPWILFGLTRAARHLAGGDERAASPA